MTSLLHTWSTPDGSGTYDSAGVCALAAANPVLHTLSQAVCARLAMLARARVFPDGSALLRAGEAGDYAYLILRGTVRIEGAEGGLPAAERGPGAILGALPNPAAGCQARTARAVGRVEVLAVSHLALALTALQYPDDALALEQAFAG